MVFLVGPGSTTASRGLDRCCCCCLGRRMPKWPPRRSSGLGWVLDSANESRGIVIKQKAGVDQSHDDDVMAVVRSSSSSQAHDVCRVSLLANQWSGRRGQHVQPF